MNVPSENNVDFAGLRAMLSSCDKNKHSRFIVLVNALLEGGVNLGPRIVGIAGRLGFNKKHAGLMLSELTGNDPVRHYWRRDDDGRYYALS
jgi:hypothetical protein